jgi:lysozyme
MNISKMGVCELASYECLCLKPYLDSGGVKTVGIGSTSSDIKDLALWSWDKELTIEEAVSIYRKGLTKYVSAVNRALTRLDIPQTLFDALVSITYNVGTGGMASSTFIKRVNAGDSLERIVEAMARWNKDNGVVVKGLVNRRAKEAKLILTGEYSSGGLVGLAPVVNKKPVYSKATSINLLNYL